MKNNYATKFQWLRNITFKCQLLQKMSCLLLVCLCIFQVPAQGKDRPKEVTVSVSASNEPVKKVLDLLEQQTGLKFFYLNKQVDTKRRVTIHLINSPLQNALEQIFKNTPVTFHISGRNIVLRSPSGKRTSSNSSEEKADTLDVARFVIEAEDAVELVVTGTVTAEGSALPGVSIIEKGTKNGTSTDAEGRYTIQVQDESATLVFSFIGYTTVELVVGNRSSVDLQMQPDIQTLSEVVVVGYGEMDKKNISAAITTVKASEMSHLKAATTIDQMLQGQGTGIQVNQASGAPGSPTRVMIRGLHSLSSSSEPLWVIDGLPLNLNVNGIGNGQNPLATINPNDIESIQVLKDAAATAIYGSRGSKGVILINTKSGKKEKGQINFNYNYGITDLVKSPSEMRFVNAEQWTAIMDQGRANVGLTTSITDPSVLPSLPATIAGKDTLSASTLSDTDWFNPILRQGSFQEFNLSGARGFEKGNMFLSANYRTEEGVLVNNSLQRFTTRANFEFEPVKNLTSGVRLQLGYSNNKSVRDGGVPSGNIAAAGGGFGNAATAPPIFPIYHPDNESGYFNILGGSNAAISADNSLYRNEYETYRVIGGVYADYRFPFFEDLSIHGEVSTDVQQGNRLLWLSRYIRLNKPNYSEYSPVMDRNLNYNVYATLDRSITEQINVNWVVGTESQRFSSSSANLFGEDIPGDLQDFGNPTTAYRYPTASFYGGERYIRSHFTRINFRLKDKYLLGGSFRRDGVSIFLPERRWSNFYGVSAGWLVSEEGFFQDVSFINNLKARASFGQTGNQEILQSATFTTYNTSTSYAGQPHLQLGGIGSPDLTWETTNAFDAGIDFGIFNNRVEISAGYYLQDVERLLLYVPIPESSGSANNSIWANVGDMKNQGLEFSVSASILKRGDFEWRSSFNITTNKSTVTSLDPTLDQKGQGIPTGNTLTVTGQKPGTFYLAQWAGIDPRTGMDMIYEVDRNLLATTGEAVRTGNIIPATSSNIDNNRFFIEGKNGLPTYFGGFTNTFSFKGLELTAMFSYQGGNYIYGNSANYLVGTGGGTFLDNIVGNTWTPESGGSTRYSVLAYNNQYFIDNNGNATLKNDNTYAYTNRIGGQLDRYLYKGDFVRLRTLQLAYNLAPSMAGKLKLQALRVYVTGNNIYTLTGYKGWDPEIVNLGGDHQSRNLNQGNSGNFLPQVKTWTVGINITL